jgi:hypothetical protein
MEKIPTKDFREARTAWQAVNSVGKPLPPAKGISMSLRYAHTAWRAFNSVGSSAAVRQRYFDELARRAHRLAGIQLRRQLSCRPPSPPGAGNGRRRSQNSNRERAIRIPRKPLKTNVRDQV